MSEPENHTLRLLREIREEIGATRNEIVGVREELHALRDEVKDEVSIASALALRATGERVNWATTADLSTGLRRLSARPNRGPNSSVCSSTPKS